MESIGTVIIICVFLIVLFSALSFDRWLSYKEYMAELKYPKKTTKTNKVDSNLWTYTIKPIKK